MQEEKTFESKKRIGLAVVLNVIITGSEWLAGIFTGSLALISDAGHNFSDVLSLILGYFGVTLAEKEPTKKYTFGYKRAEVITSVVNSSILFVIGLYILFEALVRFKNPFPVDSGWMIGVACLALLGNLASIYLLRKGRETTLNIRAVFLHLFYDSLASIGVILAGLVIYFYGLLVADLIISIFIAVLIFWSSSNILKQGLNILMQGTPRELEFEAVRNLLLKLGEVESIHDLHLWALSSQEKILSCHLCLKDKEINTDKLIKKIESKLSKEFGIEHATIQIESEKVCKTEHVNKE